MDYISYFQHYVTSSDEQFISWQYGSYVIILNVWNTNFMFVLWVDKIKYARVLTVLFFHFWKHIA
jgi:hypothetical protein